MVLRFANNLATRLLGAIAATGMLMTAATGGTDSLAGSEWKPVEIAGQAVAADTNQFIRFEVGGKAVGHAGCNRMGGNYTIDAAGLRIGPLMATRRACEPDIMAQENAFMKALEETRLYLRDQTKLTLKNAQGVTTLRLRQMDWD